ncbi:MAG: YicC/YloC family endoribonuclease [Candidatus Omnitrophota bacterium]
MIRSMTGFGRGDARVKNGQITIEIKTVNHKFFDATLKLPNNISTFEDKIKEVMQKSVARGKIYINLIYDGALAKEERISINKSIVKNYYDELKRLKKHLGLKDDITIKDLAALPGVINYEVREKGLGELWPKIKKALDKAIARLTADREKEGRSIYNDLNARAGKIEKMLTVIKSRAHTGLDEYRKRFAERVKDITGGRDIDRGRLEMEVAIFAKNSDISEEITRLKSHLVNFKKTISGSGDVGKKLDFIAQELHREINTIGSKAGDFKISKNVIEIKGEIEKIREQAKNVE